LTVRGDSKPGSASGFSSDVDGRQLFKVDTSAAEERIVAKARYRRRKEKAFITGWFLVQPS